MSGADSLLTTIGLCLTLERRDGTGSAMTSHDRPITVEGVTFEPQPGLMPNSVQQGDTDLPVSEISGAIQASSLSSEDLMSGRWDRARMTLAAACWETGEHVAELSAGQLGEVEINDGSYTVEVAAGLLSSGKPVCPVTSPECRASLGDKRCRVDLAPLRKRASITRMEGTWLHMDAEIGDDFRLGSLRVLDGSLCGWSTVVVDTSATSLRLRENMPLAPVPGTRVMITQGCDKRAETCRSRFKNMINFRGEPHVPGTDFLMRYPGA